MTNVTLINCWAQEFEFASLQIVNRPTLILGMAFVWIGEVDLVYGTYFGLKQRKLQKL